MRKAESGREGKKIPERDRGYAAARSLTGQSVTIDPGHGGADPGVVSPQGLAEKDVTLALGLRLAELLRAEGCRVQLTREADERVPLYARADAAGGARHRLLPLAALQRRAPRRRPAAPPATTSSAATTTRSTGAGWRASIGARMEARRRALAGPVRAQLRAAARGARHRPRRRAAVPHQPRGRGAGAAAGTHREAGARARRRVRRLSRARPARTTRRRRDARRSRRPAHPPHGDAVAAPARARRRPAGARRALRRRARRATPPSSASRATSSRTAGGA